jgi:oligopeptide/dipeptide ABC transporter ATP-binding protein
MSEKVLEIEDIQVEFKIGKRFIPAVSGVSLSIERGKTLGVVGESGCGKTVTANSVMRLLPKRASRVTRGSIRVCGRELAGISDYELNQVRGRDMSMIFQEPMTSLNPVHTVGAQLREMLYAHLGSVDGAAGRGGATDAAVRENGAPREGGNRISRKEADAICVDMLRQVGIPAPEQRMREFPHMLSGGMRQRVMIAMALLCRPALLIADEPTTALDVTIQAQILELINRLRSEFGTSVMLITHDMGVIAGNCDDVAVMYAGRVLEYNSVEAVFMSPRHPYTYGLLKSVPRVDEDMDSLYNIRGLVPTLEDMPSGCRFAERCDYACSLCRSEDPGAFAIGGGQVRCWLYREDAPEEIEARRRQFEREMAENPVSSGAASGSGIVSSSGAASGSGAASRKEAEDND